MSYVKGILREEQKRLKELSEKYSAEIMSRPRGSISVKKRNLKEYLYIASRDKDRVRFEYIGPVVSRKAQNIIKDIELRKEYESKLKQVKKDLMEIERLVNGRSV